MKAWPTVALGAICTVANRNVAPVAGETYRQLGVRLWGDGAYEREQIDGGDTKYAHFNRIEKDDLVVNKIWARNGAVAVATTVSCPSFFVFQGSMVNIETGRTRSEEDTEAGVHG